MHRRGAYEQWYITKHTYLGAVAKVGALATLILAVADLTAQPP